MSNERNNLLTSIVSDVTECRHKLHQNPATSYEEVFASDLIAEKLTEWGIEFERGWAKTGIVATIHGQETSSGKSIAFRGDIDALDIVEESGVEHSSKIKGKMHACGHDGHTSMLLGTAKYLSETRNFNGTVHLFFQPAEEGGGGAYRMIKEGLFKKYPVESVFAVHNWPYAPRGLVAIKNGAIMACSDELVIKITGKGGHAAMPHECIDPVVIASEIVISLQTIVSRTLDPSQSAVISITNFNAGTGANNIIPSTADLRGTIRAFDTGIRDLIEQKIKNIVEGTAQKYGASATLEYIRNYEPTINSQKEADLCADVAKSLFGEEHVLIDFPPSMAAEDFGAMLMEKPGCYAIFGQGEPQNPDSPHNFGLHHPKYDFNDKIISSVISYFAGITEKALPL